MLRRGGTPAGTPRNNKTEAKKYLMDIKNCMYEVGQPPVQDDGRVLECTPCKANPFNFACRICKSYAHDGICKHVLAVTHIEMGIRGRDEQMLEGNVFYMTKQLARKPKKGRVNPTTGALVPQRHMTSSQKRELKKTNRRRERHRLAAVAAEALPGYRQPDSSDEEESSDEDEDADDVDGLRRLMW